uniref:Uncharacterized protein n=1 Tax=mine drainage metagenome TaxID=410659 RepID=E6QLK7_9ZZZZ
MEVRSCFRLRHCQQSTQMTCIESQPYQQAAPTAQANLVGWIMIRLLLAVLVQLLQFHFHKFRRFAFANPLHPIANMRITKTAVTTECTYRLTALTLLQYSLADASRLQMLEALCHQKSLAGNNA